MPHIQFKGALNAATFPLLSTLQPRTVVQPQLDSNVRQSRAFYGTDESADYNVPQLLYCENVVPTAEGVQSVGYDTLIPANLATGDFDQCITLRDADENNFLFAPANGKNYVYTANVNGWASVSPINGWTGGLVTKAYVNGRTFICYEGFGIYEFNAITNQVVKQVIIGLAEKDIRGIGASSNYLIAFGNLQVFWSSLVNPLDFVASLTTGAGNAIPQDVKAKITAVIGIAGGFVIYTQKNAVGAVYTNNTRAPFVFKEISNAGGIASYEQVTNEQNAGPHYAWTTGGLQKITIQGSESVSAEVNDFLAGKQFEIFDPVNKRLIQSLDSNTEFAVKITYISSRYLLVSYSAGASSTNTYNYVLFYDTVLKRWGKLKIDHVDCFTYPYPNLFGNLKWSDLFATTWNALKNTTWYQLSRGVNAQPPSKQAIAFLLSDGTVKLLRMDYAKEVQHQGVAIFGKFQLTRQKLLQMQEVEFEGIYQNNQQFQCTAISSFDGKNTSKLVPMKLLNFSDKFARFAKRLTGVNVSLVAEGTFAFSSYILTVVQDGDR